MDAKKRLSPSLRAILFSLGCATLVLLVYLIWVWWTLETLADPKSCLVTKWKKVRVCPTDQSYLRFREIPELTWRALVLAEDGSFFQHPGYDLFELRESFRRNWEAGRYVRGGSTITQQLAKNLYLTPEKSLRRKFKEFLIAQRLEESLSKQEILEKYLNVVEFGPDIYGLRAASRHYFSRQPADLNLLEVTYLISIIPNPKKFSAGFSMRKLNGQNQWRMKIILNRLRQVGRISSTDYERAVQLLETLAWPFQEFDRAPQMPTFEEMDFSPEPSSETLSEDAPQESSSEAPIETNSPSEEPAAEEDSTESPLAEDEF